MRGKLVGAVLEEMVGAGDLAEVDLDIALVRQLVHQLLHRIDRHQRVGVALEDQPGRRAGGEKGEIVLVRRRRDRDERIDLRPPHQQLHADPGAERIARHPAGLGVGVVGLQPVERRRGVGQLALAAVEAALAAPDPAEIEAQGGKTALHKALVQRIDDTVVHRPAVQRMRMQHQRHRRRRLAHMMIAALEPPLRAVEDHVRHVSLDSIPTVPVG
jgi:hypothetical protein